MKNSPYQGSRKKKRQKELEIKELKRKAKATCVLEKEK